MLMCYNVITYAASIFTKCPDVDLKRMVLTKVRTIRQTMHLGQVEEHEIK